MCYHYTIPEQKLGIPRGTRTPTNGFGDRHAAITSERYYLVPTQGNDPWSNAYQACALPLSYAGEISTALLPMQVSKHTESSSPTMNLRPAQYASIRSVFSHTTRSASHPRGRPHLQF